MPVTELDIRKQVRRLEAVYRAPKSTDELVESWKWVLGSDVSPEELMAAVSDYAKSSARYFPTPGQIREAAFLRRTHSGEAHQGPKDWTQTMDGPCPVCGAVLRMLDPDEQVQTAWDDVAGEYTHQGAPALNPRFGVLHDRRQHESARTPAVGFWR